MDTQQQQRTSNLLRKHIFYNIIVGLGSCGYTYLFLYLFTFEHGGVRFLVQCLTYEFIHRIGLPDCSVVCFTSESFLLAIDN